MRQLALDVRSGENAFEVHPVLLAGQPFIKGIAEQVQLAIHSLHFMPYACHISVKYKMWSV